MTDPNPLRTGLRIARTPEPCTVVIFGATGDLTARKLLPALYNLAKEGMVPGNIALVGVGRRPWSDDDFRAEMRRSADQHSRSLPVNEEVWQNFAGGLFWVGGAITTAAPRGRRT